MRTAMAAISILLLVVAVVGAHTDLTTAQVKAILDAGGNVVVVDVREDYEYCDSLASTPGHIAGSINMPWNSGVLQANFGDLDPTDSTIVVCRSGNRSNTAANFLDGEGFTSVFDMLGGMTAWQYETELCAPAGIPGDLYAGSLSLSAASPSPFSSTTRITYSVPAAQAPSEVMLSIYDSMGRLVARPVDGDRHAGTHHVDWNGSDQLGRSMPSGVYFYRLAWKGQHRTGSVVLLR
jgi:rhodanese-related sulfurtransferase